MVHHGAQRQDRPAGPGQEPTSHQLAPDCGPTAICNGPDGALWFTEIAAGQIGRRTPDGWITEYPLPNRSARPHAATTDADGTAWFTEWGGNRVGSVISDGTVTVHDLPTPASEAHGITVGPDGALWTALETGALARIKPSTNRTAIATKHTEQRKPLEVRPRDHREFASRARIRTDRDAHRTAYETWTGELAAAGKLAGGDALDTEHQGPVTLRKTADGSATVTEGPVHSGEEPFVGWFVPEVADRSEAIELARGFPTPEALEIRPILESA
ncbi:MULTISPECIES: YciI family protein [unclassified Streptomyces]|uniref:virginiamycin B lyase family protein n=1 Tax=unclassified Streptomyces TaxID=2593676 RepID=UPI00332B5E72